MITDNDNLDFPGYQFEPNISELKKLKKESDRNLLIKYFKSIVYQFNISFKLIRLVLYRLCLDVAIRVVSIIELIIGKRL